MVPQLLIVLFTKQFVASWIVVWVGVSVQIVKANYKVVLWMFRFIFGCAMY